MSIDEIEVGERLADAELFASWTPLFEPPMVVKSPKLDVAVLADAAAGDFAGEGDLWWSTPFVRLRMQRLLKEIIAP